MNVKTSTLSAGHRVRGRHECRTLDETQDLLLHTEPRASHSFDRRRRSGQLDIGRVLTTEQVQQQFAWRPGDEGRRLPPPCSNGLSGPCPLKFESCAAQSPCEEPRPATDVAPKGPVHRL